MLCLYTLKDKINAISSGYHTKQNKIRKYIFLNKLEVLDPQRVENIKRQFNLKYGSWELMDNINKNRWKKKRRIEERIYFYVASSNAWWITLNFNDHALSLSEDTRRQYVRRYFAKHYPHYVANIDYGSNKEYIDRKGNKRIATNREHYHAVILSDNRPNIQWEHGFSHIEKINIHKLSLHKITLYITKLSNHALKNSTKNKRIIYSKDYEYKVFQEKMRKRKASFGKWRNQLISQMV